MPYKFIDTIDRCVETVTDYSLNWPRVHQCERRWKVEVNGKHYCTQHSPERVAQRRAITEAHWNKDWEDRKRGWVSKAACAGVPVENLPGGIVKKLIAFAYEMDNEELIKEIEGKY